MFFNLNFTLKILLLDVERVFRKFSFKNYFVKCSTYLYWKNAFEQKIYLTYKFQLSISSALTSSMGYEGTVLSSISYGRVMSETTVVRFIGWIPKYDQLNWWILCNHFILGLPLSHLLVDSTWRIHLAILCCYFLITCLLHREQHLWKRERILC